MAKNVASGLKMIFMWILHEVTDNLTSDKINCEGKIRPGVSEVDQFADHTADVYMDEGQLVEHC